MQFFCPNCQQTVDIASETTITTKFNQTAYKAHCPVCTKDLAVYGNQEAPVNVSYKGTDVSTPADTDTALHEFSQTVV